MPLRTYLPVAIAISGAAMLSVAFATVAVEKIETGARMGIVRSLQHEGIGWADVDVDGLRVEIRGTAPDEAARFNALAAAGRVVDATRVVDRIEVTPGQSIEAPEFKIEILRNLDGVSLIGLIPSEYDRTQILDRIGQIAETPVTDLLEEGRYPVPDGWAEAVDFALTAIDTVPRSKVSMTADDVAVTGIVDSEDAKREIEAVLRERAPDSLALTVEIEAPRPVIAPFTLRFVKSGASARFDACAAETQEDRNRILVAARQAGAPNRVSCRIGLGAPSHEWAEAAVQAIGALDDIGQGTVTFSDADVSLVAPHLVTQREFDRVVGQLERRLPPGFSLAAVRNPPPEEDEEASEGGVQEFLAVRRDDGSVELSGRLATARTRTAVESYAHAHFGKSATQASTRLDDTLPAGWSIRAFAALDALSHLATGSVRMREDSLTVSGETGREDAPAEIARLLSDSLGSDAQYEIDVTYVEQLDPLLNIPTPEECVKELNTIVAVQKLSFEPGSATLSGPSLQVIDQLAGVLKDCQDVPIEIGAHSDSQGRESMNLQLSQERANAVLNAILERRVLTANLEAKGYGESTPIADNDTEAGREANRRIEFTLISDTPEEATDGADEETADAEGDGAEEDSEEAAE